MPTSSIPALPSEFLPAVGTAVTNAIASISAPVELLVGMFIAFIIIAALFDMLTDRNEAPSPSE